MNSNRMIRLHRYLLKNDGWLPRDVIMHWTGFPSPKDQPICAYVEFAIAVDLLNRSLRRSLRRSGRRVEGGLHTGERYRLVAIEARAA